MQQKKFSTMLTLKIINVFLADSTLRETRSADIERVKGREVRVDEEKRRGGKEPRRLSTSRMEDRGEPNQHGKRLGPVRQCTSASSAEGRAATLHPQTGGREGADEVVRRRGEEFPAKEEGGQVRKRREEVEPMVVSAHKLQIENKKAQGGDRTPNPGRREQPPPPVAKRGGGGKRGEIEEGKRLVGVKEGKRREDEGKRNRGQDTSTRDSLRQ